MKNVSVLGIDIAKDSFELCGGTSRGRILLRKGICREGFIGSVREQDPRLVLMEACGGANHWGREFQKMGYEVKLIAPQFVKPYRKSNKNDRADAEAVMEAGLRPTMRFVSVKTLGQQDILSLHCVRQRLVKHRTAVANEMRGLLLEYGVAIPKGISNVRTRLWEIVEVEREKLTDTILGLVTELKEEFDQADARVKKLDKRLEKMAQKHPVCIRLMTIPGVGPLTSTAIVGYVGDPQVFKRGRDFAAYFGLVPKQHTTGGKPKLGRISKRGDKYIRQLLVHGSRSVLAAVNRKNKTDSRSKWIKQLKERKGFNKSCVALANKNARVIWVLMANDDQEYQHDHKYCQAA